MIIADSSTISPSATLRFAERVKARGVDYVDAPMTGSKIAAEAGKLIFMVGGDEAALARLQPLFQAMGKQVFHMGETGKGQATKLAMNLQIALIYEGFAEALTLATKLGVDVEKMLPLIQASMVRSGVVDYKAPFILKRDFSPNFPLRLMLKDIRLALDAAKEARVRLPGLEAVEEVYDVAAEEGQADLDYAATLTLLEKWAGVEVKAASKRRRRLIANPDLGNSESRIQSCLTAARRALLGSDGRGARPPTNNSSTSSRTSGRSSPYSRCRHFWRGCLREACRPYPSL